MYVHIPLRILPIFVNTYERRLISSCTLCSACPNWVVFCFLTCVFYLGYVSPVERIPCYKISFFPIFLHASISPFIFLASDIWIDGQIDKFHIDFSFRYAGTLCTAGVPRATRDKRIDPTHCDLMILFPTSISARSSKCKNTSPAMLPNHSRIPTRINVRLNLLHHFVSYLLPRSA